MGFDKIFVVLMVVCLVGVQYYFAVKKQKLDRETDELLKEAQEKVDYNREILDRMLQ